MVRSTHLKNPQNFQGEIKLNQNYNYKDFEPSDGPSEGEKFIGEFFYSEGIDFDTEVPLNSLKQDTKAFRKADFYLINYKVYVEFFGRWNSSDEDKRKYREKMRVYNINNIPCIYLFPENLGIIHYSFRYRLRRVLKNHNMKKELFHFNLKQFIDDKLSSIFWFAIIHIFIGPFPI